MNNNNIKIAAAGRGYSKAFYILASFVALSFAFYLFFIGQTVGRLVSEKNLVSSNRALATEISELELQALSLNDSVSIEKAYEMGFVNAKSTQYVSKNTELTLR